jgi:hypothetical protein
MDGTLICLSPTLSYDVYLWRTFGDDLPYTEWMVSSVQLDVGRNSDHNLPHHSLSAAAVSIVLFVAVVSRLLGLLNLF